ncbi:helix-turn-helix domain-containing protein [Roseburia hominis]|uniref:helix-turn-helix domain-containing protein n=1 Tax=Roseburia hominis TaxID=301301 RepID=UPI001C0308EF|nr:helix-turn-helix domain-containing protein [Roseburia hominis]MBT9667197.1 MerR family transcriptional regulator [Roseburia hominis]
MEKVRYMISDAANIVHVESHVLRYWEDELELNIPRNEMGHRYYTKENIAEFQRIKELKEQGYQLKAIRMIVHNGPIEGLTAEAPIPVGQAPLSAGAAAAIPQPVQPVAAQPAAVAQPVQQSVQPVQPVAAQPAAVAQPVQQSVQPVQPAAPQQLPVKTTAESPQSILNNTDKMAQFTELMTEIVGKALAANNEELGQSISEEVGKQVIKEMNYLMREREEAEEDRFRRLDAAIRGNIRKKDEQKEKKLWKKKKPSQA